MSSNNLLQIGKLLSQNSCLFLCDMQVKFRPSVKYFDEIVKNSNRMLRAAKILDMPVVVTEQYPQGEWIVADFLTGVTGILF